MPPSAAGSKGRQTSNDEAIFNTFSIGINTNRMSGFIDLIEANLIDQVQRKVLKPTTEVDRWKRAGRPRDIDNFVE